ncbi:hypothetical protein [Shewanella waksmanii]|uniref:hypothetical protein n=1 Tax=Shewanella waksmanii TaxID=213783 RepID=UPI0004B6A9AF|nr:hypothetical protein [Shewanella waksmanii]
MKKAHLVALAFGISVGLSNFANAIDTAWLYDCQNTYREYGNTQYYGEQFKACKARCR